MEQQRLQMNWDRKMWGVTGQKADHPILLQGEMNWIEITYKIVVARLKYEAIRNLSQDRAPLFSESDMQHAAVDLTQQIFRRNSQGELVYLSDFYRDFGDAPRDRAHLLKGIVQLKKVVLEFLGE